MRGKTALMQACGIRRQGQSLNDLYKHIIAHSARIFNTKPCFFRLGYTVSVRVSKKTDILAAGKFGRRSAGVRYIMPPVFSSAARAWAMTSL